MTIDLNEEEINLILSSIGLSLNVVHDPAARQQLEALQTKLMEHR